MNEPRAHRDRLLEGQEQTSQVSLATRDGALESSLTPSASRRLAFGIGAFLVLMLAPYALPGAERFQPWRAGEGYIPFWNLIGRELLGEGAALADRGEQLGTLEAIAVQAEQEAIGARPPDSTAARRPAPGAAQSVAEGSASGSEELYPAYVAHADDEHSVDVSLEGISALDYYYGQLALTDLKKPGAITRGSHWGDSVLGGDGLTHAIRTRLQARFGDAGHGYHALGRYNLAYSHLGVRFGDRGGWRSCEIIFKCESDAKYGYAGVSSTSSGGGTSRWRTAKSGFGSNVSRFELWYATAPGGGRFQIKVNGEVDRVVETEAAALGDAVETVLVEDGEHAFEVRAIGGGVSRGYGVVLERDVPGVVWDELSMIGAFTQRLDYQDPDHIAWQVRRRDVDVMVFLLGGNDVQRQKMDLYRTMQPYEEEYTRVIRKFRAGKPEASCLIMSVTDHGERVGKYGIQTRRIVPQLVESQRKVALAEGCAFYDTFSAMGGKDAIGRWYHATPRLANADFSHPTVAGQEVIATLFYRALMKGYADFRTNNEGRPLPELGVAPANAERDRRDAVPGK
jgi:lysophospholipase L1-like esterase